MYGVSANSYEIMVFLLLFWSLHHIHLAICMRVCLCGRRSKQDGYVYRHLVVRYKSNLHNYDAGIHGPMGVIHD